MSDGKLYRIAPLKWQRMDWSTDEFIEHQACNAFGYMSVKWRVTSGWEWGFCFSVHFDESYFPCSNFREGKQMATRYWEIRVRSLLTEVRPPRTTSPKKTFSRLFTGATHGKA